MDGLTPQERSALDVIARAGPEGVLLSVLRHNLSSGGAGGSVSMDQTFVTEIIRNLMSSQKITVARAPSGGDHVVSLRKPPVSENFHIVMEVIRRSGSSGIDVAGIMSRTKIPKAEIAKAISTFTQQQSIKEARCFTNKARKLYIAAEFEPSADVTGGTFYTEARDLDTAFIDLVRHRVVAHLRVAGGSATVHKLKAALEQDPRIAQRRITVREVSTVARALHLDGVLRRTDRNESVLEGFGERIYTLANAPDQHPIAAAMLAAGLGPSDVWAATFPCVSCPQMMSCQPRGVINPGTCAYLADWLDASANARKAATAAAEATAMEAVARPQPRPTTDF